MFQSKTLTTPAKQKPLFGLVALKHEQFYGADCSTVTDLQNDAIRVRCRDSSPLPQPISLSAAVTVVFTEEPAVIR